MKKVEEIDTAHLKGKPIPFPILQAETIDVIETMSPEGEQMLIVGLSTGSKKIGFAMCEEDAAALAYAIQQSLTRMIKKTGETPQ